MVLRASETDATAYKAFCSRNINDTESATSCNKAERVPTLTVTYNTLPATAANLGTIEPTSCPDGNALPEIGTLQPTLSSSASDADNPTTKVKFDVQTANGTTTVASGESEMVTQGTTATWKIPSGKLANGVSYRWRAMSNDGLDWAAAASPWRQFTVNTAMDTQGSQIVCLFKALDLHRIDNAPSTSEGQIRLTATGSTDYQELVGRMEEIRLDNQTYGLQYQGARSEITAAAPVATGPDSATVLAHVDTWLLDVDSIDQDHANAVIDWNVSLERSSSGQWAIDAIDYVPLPDPDGLPVATSSSAEEAATLIEHFTPEITEATARTSDLTQTSTGFLATHTDGSITSIPDSATEPIEIAEGLAVLPAGEDAESTSGVAVGGAVIYPNTGQDIDTVVAPSTDGTESFSMLRTPAAAETLRSQITLAEGQRLEVNDDGVAAVLDVNDDPVMFVTAPWAIDANGTPVPLSLDVEGADIVIQVDHRGTAAAYPILVDPKYISYGSEANAAEKAYCKSPTHWLACDNSRYYSNVAIKDTERRFKNTKKDPDTLQTGQGAAYRHCYWMTLLVISTKSETVAKKFGDLHEEDPTQHERRKTMGLRNNAIGRTTGTRWDEVEPNTLKGDRQASSDARFMCEWLARNGQMWVIKDAGTSKAKLVH